MSPSWQAALARRVATAKARRARIGPTDRSCEGRGRTALVTGASSGIGRSMSELLAAKGYDVTLVARRASALEDVRCSLERTWGVRSHVIVADLGAADAPRHICEELQSRSLHIDVLVNNAGYSAAGLFAEQPWADHERFLRVMGLAPAELCHRLVPAMQAHNWGRVINVTSIGGLMPGMPGMAMYGATKSFLQKLTEALAAESKARGVLCTVSAPGGTDTEAFAASGITDYVSSRPLIQLTMMSPDAVAREAYAACMAGRRLIVHGWPNRTWAAALTHSPARTRYALVKFLARITPDPPRVQESPS